MLKPCPFCKSDDTEIIHILEKDEECFYVVCHGCGARGPLKPVMSPNLGERWAEFLVFGSPTSKNSGWKIVRDATKKDALDSWNNYD